MTKRQRREHKAAQMTIAANTKRNMNTNTEIEVARSTKAIQPERIEIINADAVQTRAVRSERMVQEIEAVSTSSVSSISSIEFMHNVRF